MERSLFFGVALLSVFLAACGGRKAGSPGPTSPEAPSEVFPEVTSSSKPQNLCYKNNPKAARRDVVGVWIASIDSYVLDSRDNISRSLDRLPKLGVNTVFPVVWNKGAIFFRDPMLVHEIGQSPHMPKAYKNRDVLAEVVAKAKNIKLDVLPWFEFGLKITSDMPIFTQKPEWFLKNVKGEMTERFDNFSIAYLNPQNQEVRDFYKKLFVSGIRSPSVDGFQIDDHFGYPPEYGYDDLTVSIYKAEHKGMEPPRDPKDPDWMRWRSDKLTEAWAEIVSFVRGYRPDIRISLAPNLQRYAYEKSLQDWKTWMEKGLVDEIVLQNYKRGIPNFTQELEQDYVLEALKCVPFSVGILAGVETGVNAADVVAGQIRGAWRAGMEGVSFFHYPFLVGKRPPEVQKKFLELFPEIIHNRLPAPEGSENQVGGDNQDGRVQEPGRKRMAPESKPAAKAVQPKK